MKTTIITIVGDTSGAFILDGVNNVPYGAVHMLMQEGVIVELLANANARLYLRTRMMSSVELRDLADRMDNER